jgi:DNA repair protein SbcD/Mre11
MRILHTSDWHLGKSLHGHDLAEAQDAALNFMVDLAIEKEVDAFIVAGDVYDRSFPSVEDVRRLNTVFTRIHVAGIPIICTAGNHDEGARLAALANLLDEGVTVVGEYHQVGTSVTLRDEHGPVAIYPLPYLHPDGARRDLAPTDGPLLERSHEAVVAEAMRRIRADLAARQDNDPTTRAVVVSHAFVVRGEETPEELRHEQSESERDIAVGGVPSVPSGTYDGVHYVALGHLHGPRTVQLQQPGRPAIRYAGSPLRYSLSEATHVKTVTIVDIDADGLCTIEDVPVPQPAGMARLRGELDVILSDAHAAQRDDFVEIVLTDRDVPDNFLAQVMQVFTRILKVRHEPIGGGAETIDVAGPATSAVVTPLETLRNFFAVTRQEEPSEAITAILVDALERARASVES